MLDLTPKKMSEREALVINPAKTCQPIGAMYAAIGVHNCLPHSHGSQGCCSYHRMQLTRHFKEPIMASTSSFTEGASVFGGASNLKQAARNIFQVYNPDIIAVHTTCLSETIGDDLNSIIRGLDIPEGKIVMHANTPSYVGSHVTGFANMVKGFVTYLAQKTDEANDTINIIPGFVSPAEMREMKRLMSMMGLKYIMFPDTSGVVDAPMSGKSQMFPKGGTTIADLKLTGNSVLTLAMGEFASEPGAVELDKKCNVPFETMTAPLGIEATDRFLMKLSKLSGNPIPEELEEERGQLVDIMLDSHSYFYGKKIAISGDPDIVYSMVEFALSLGLIPKFVFTGTPGKKFERDVKELLVQKGITDSVVKAKGDLFELHQLIKNESVDFMIGNSHCKYIAKAEDIPLVRLGFPILDRYVHQYIPAFGYKGAIYLMQTMINLMLEKQDSTCEDEDLELVM
jgi:nitrogenase molybdenum-iron protein beta chain